MHLISVVITKIVIYNWMQQDSHSNYMMQYTANN